MLVIPFDEFTARDSIDAVDLAAGYLPRSKPCVDRGPAHGEKALHFARAEIGFVGQF